MRLYRNSHFVTLFGVLFLAFTSSFAMSAQKSKLIISTEEQIREDIFSSPCKDNERLIAAKALFMKVGAQEKDILIEKLDNTENLIIRKQAQSQETIIIGAHYDKVPDGCGAIDNWSGIVAVAHVYRSLKDVPLQKNLIFVAFGKEEKGLLGSKAMVKAIKKEKIDQYCAMINIDSLGMAAPQVPVNLSSKTLANRAVEVAQRMKIPFNKVTINGGADSVSFTEKKIPAMTISAVGNGWEQVLHTNKDQVANVNTTSVYLGYRLVLGLVTELSELPCDVSRK